MFAAKALAERMRDGLSARGLTCVRVLVQVTWQNGQQSTRLWRHDGVLSSVQIADRVRWQLDAWRGAPRDAELDPAVTGGIMALRLAPDQVVHAVGQQLALWGETVISDRVARAALRVQAILGPGAVLRPVISGGRDPRDQVTHVAFGEKNDPDRPVDQPWPGRIPGAAPAVVYPVPREAEVTDDAGHAVVVTGRCALSAPPALLAISPAFGSPRPVTAWAGPWPLSERWWDPAAAHRRARFQLVTDDGRAWLAVVEDGRWLIEAGYW